MSVRWRWRIPPLHRTWSSLQWAWCSCNSVNAVCNAFNAVWNVLDSYYILSDVLYIKYDILCSLKWCKLHLVVAHVSVYMWSANLVCCGPMLGPRMALEAYRMRVICACLSDVFILWLKWTFIFSPIIIPFQIGKSDDSQFLIKCPIKVHENLIRAFSQKLTVVTLPDLNLIRSGWYLVKYWI